MLIRRSHIAMLHDVAMAAASFPVALFLRWGRDFYIYADAYLWQGMAMLAMLMLGVEIAFRSYRALWRYVSMSDLVTITQVVTVALILFYLMLFATMRLEGVPRSIPIIHWLALGAMLGAPRFAYRMVREGSFSAALTAQGNRLRQVPVLLIGAGDTAEQFIRETGRRTDSPYRVVGMVSADTALVGRFIHNTRIFPMQETWGRTLEKISRRVERPQKLVLAEEWDGKKIEALLRETQEIGLSLARLPRMGELAAGAAINVQPIAIADVLGRAQNVHDKNAMRALVAGRRVLVTGAGGTIGGELSRQIAGFAPASLTLVDHGEFNLYTIHAEVAEAEIPLHPRLCNVRDAAGMEHIFAETKPELVFHAAAIKHVPIAEDNPEEAVLTNVFGSARVAELCAAHGVAAMVMISTDKAVNPGNVMGATKRIAEMVCQAMGGQTPPSVPPPAGGGNTATRFITVRFGNVLGSTGSVVPLFQKQLAAGGPLTVTHPDMVRYFMTVREAVELVLQAAVLGMEMPPETAPIFVLDMGRPIKIADLAAQMIRLSGRTPGVEVEIKYTGLRPGEKLFEELFHPDENLEKTAHGGILLAHPRSQGLAELRPVLAALRQAADARDTTKLRALLHQLVPEFQYHA